MYVVKEIIIAFSKIETQEATFSSGLLLRCGIDSQTFMRGGMPQRKICHMSSSWASPPPFCRIAQKVERELQE
jgi:hypothetical protein